MWVGMAFREYDYGREKRLAEIVADESRDVVIEKMQHYADHGCITFMYEVSPIPVLSASAPRE